MRRLLLTTTGILMLLALQAQTPTLLSTIITDTLSEATLYVDWKRLQKKRPTRSYFPANLACVSPHHDTLQMEARVRTRGNMRFNICSQPPLKIKLDKEVLAKRGFPLMNEMDVVRPCHDASSFEQFLLREFLAYKLWELVSPYYFRTQLVRLAYANPDGTPFHEPAFAFLVEDPEELVSRLDGRRYAPEIVSQQAVDSATLLTVCLFQFMIGNTDWFITNRHNMDFFGLPGHRLLVPVPYDFDYAGLVDAPYAAPHTNMPFDKVTTRYYQGRCHTEAEVRAALRPFLEQKDKILALAATIPGLDERSIRHVTGYLQGFFEIIENPKKLEQQVIKHCDRWPVD